MARISRAPTVTWPASTMHGRAAAAADVATPWTTFPLRDEWS
jgi:hypothetical protein